MLVNYAYARQVKVWRKVARASFSETAGIPVQEGHRPGFHRPRCVRPACRVEIQRHGAPFAIEHKKGADGRINGSAVHTGTTDSLFAAGRRGRYPFRIWVAAPWARNLRVVDGKIRSIARPEFRAILPRVREITYGDSWERNNFRRDTVTFNRS